MKKYINKNNNYNTTDSLHKYIYNVYAWMSLGLLLTSITSWYTSKIKFIIELIYFSKFFMISIVTLQFILVITLSNMINKISANKAIIMFLLYSFITGLTTSGIFLTYTYNTLFITFIISSIMFASMSIIGYLYKQDLTKPGNISLMCLTGVIISTIVNIWIKSEYITYITSYITIIIFAILTAWDTQKIKEIGNNIILEHKDQLIKYSIIGALLLYLDFINIYLNILKIIGTNKNKDNEENNN